MSFKVALSATPGESQVFYNDELVEGVTKVAAEQQANGMLRLTLDISAPTLDQLSVIVGNAIVRTTCPRCNYEDQHNCRGNK